MRIALIGDGKTGGEIPAIIGVGDSIERFNVDRQPTRAEIQTADVAIVFVPGVAVAQVLPVLLEASRPVVWGSTGCEWPKNLNDHLVAKGIAWIHASNYSLAMNLVRHAIKILGTESTLLSNPRFTIHEIHHAKKIDAPSGTALSWQEWLQHDAKITSDRIGDVVGLHRLTIETDNERITIEHEAKSRKLFAEGALWAARLLAELGAVPPGFHRFDSVADSKLL